MSIVGLGPMSAGEALFGVDLVVSDPGAAVATMPAPPGEPGPEWYLAMVDMVLGLAAWSTEISDRTGVTLGLRLEVLPPPRSAARSTLTATGRLDWVQGDASGSIGEVVDDIGQLLARCTGTFLRIDAPAPEPDPRLRMPTPAASFDELVALHATTGAGDLGLVSLADGAVLANPRGLMHGGIQAAVLARGMQRTLEQRGARAPRLVSLAVDYLEPVPVEAPPSFTFAAERAGSRVAFVSGVVAAADGTPGARARGILQLR